MDLTTATITMDPAAAAERAEAYRRLAVPLIEEKQILAGYLALAAGKQIIRLSDTIVAGGCDEHGWPRLAVMRATQTWCYLRVAKRDESSWDPAAGQMRWRTVGVDWEFVPERWTSSTMTRSRFSFAVPPIEDVTTVYYDRRAMVPIVPPDRRPTWRGRRLKLDNFVVLWEVPEWEKSPRPPGDPALLRHLAGDLYTVEAVWDLTDLEQAVLAGRNRP